MATKKKREPETEPEPLTGTVVEAGAVLGISREQCADLAESWERAADDMNADAGVALARSGGFGDLALVMVTGTVAQVRADALRDCARELRALIDDVPPGERIF